MATLAARQRGHVTREQLFELGISDDRIHRRLKTGRLHRVFPVSMPLATLGRLRSIALPPRSYPVVRGRF
jgi:hypothetical protein